MTKLNWSRNGRLSLDIRRQRGFERKLTRTLPVMERLEERTLLAVNTGTVLIGPMPPSNTLPNGNTGPLNMLYNGSDTPATNQGGYTGIYQVPGIDATGGNPNTLQVPYAPGGTTTSLANVPYIVNGSNSFEQAGLVPQSNDWWSPLMFRIDPITITNTADNQQSYIYGNSYLYQDPGVLRFINTLFGPSQSGAPDWVQGLGIFNPDTFGITPGPQGSQATTTQGFYVDNVSPVTVGIGSGKEVGGIAPLIGSNGPGTNTDEAQLVTRVNDYSDWGVQVVYGDGNPDAPTDQRANTLTIDMMNGSPYIDFTKTGTAPADVWLRVIGAQSYNEVWGSSDLPDQGLGENVLGVTSDVNWVDTAGVTHTNISSYLVVAPSGTTWSASYPSATASQPQLFTNSGIGSGQMVAILMPSMVGQTPFNALPAADQVAIAKMMMAHAFNFPVNSPSATQVSNPTAQQELYNGQMVTFGYNQATSQVLTKYNITTANNQPTDTLLYPAQYNNLLPSDQQHFLTYVLDGVPQPIEYLTVEGTAKLYSSPTNTFATELTYSGILPYLPSTAAQTDPGAAEALYVDAEQWFTSYIAAPDNTIGPTENTYLTGLDQLGQQLIIIDQLASPNSLLSPSEQATAAGWRDRILQDLEYNLISWFDGATGRIFQFNTMYDTLIGYPAGHGSDFAIADRSLQYGYFLEAFAAVAQFNPGFVEDLMPEITLMVDDVAMGRPDWYPEGTQLPSMPFLRMFNPFDGHDWANGIWSGGPDLESIAESIQFYSAMSQLGAMFNNPAWLNIGVYLYTTEVESEKEYWFNENADPAQGNYGNWPKEFVQYILNSTPTVVTQIANPRSAGPDRTLFFADPNYAEGIYGINWLPIESQSLYLGNNPTYLEENWAQFIQDYNTQQPTVGSTAQGVYELLVAAYQALLPDQGTGLDDPGPSNALLRLDPAYNPVVIPPAPANVVPQRLHRHNADPGPQLDLHSPAARAGRSHRHGRRA